MKRVVVTGANGFIGQNILARLISLDELEVHTVVRDTPKSEFEDLLASADLIYHLAGINRPQSDEEFNQGNTELTREVIEVVKNVKTNPLMLMSSSTQVEKDNPYGASKKAAENLLIEARDTLRPVIFRLPGVFGKWCRPNYNSVVATFCYNVANGLPLQISDRNHKLPLVYIDDVVNQFMEYLHDDKELPDDHFDSIRTQYEVSLGFLADTIQSFPESRKTLRTPRVGDALVKRLYSTYLSYLPEDSFFYKMNLKVDNRGDLFEWIKSEDFGQIFISTTKPGITRGNHYHHTKTEKFLVIRGDAVIRFRKVGDDKVIEYPVSGREPTVVDIPTGYTHNITNVGESELITLFWANEILDQDNPDTYFLKV